MKVMKLRYYCENIKQFMEKLGQCILLLYTHLTLAEGWLTDLWLWLIRESSDVLQKYFYEERTGWGSHRYKNSQIFCYFSFIYQLKKSEVWLLTQVVPGLTNQCSLEI